MSQIYHIVGFSILLTKISIVKQIYIPALSCAYNIDSEDYIGCFTDTEERMFPFIYSGNSFPATLTNELCYLGCAKEGFKYAATKSMNWCYCGDDPYRDPVEWPQRPESECNYNCPGNTSQKCGGHLRMSITLINTYTDFGIHQKYRTAYNGKQVTGQPLNVTVVKGAKLQAAIACAQICGDTTECYVFSVSTLSLQCKLFTALESCNLAVDPDTSVYKLI